LELVDLIFLNLLDFLEKYVTCRIEIIAKVHDFMFHYHKLMFVKWAVKY